MSTFACAEETHTSEQGAVGTFLNESPTEPTVPLRPGDWIRLGSNGPLLRFLGQAVEASVAESA